MASLVIKNLPQEMHTRLQQEARLHRRSMIQQALVVLENGLMQAGTPPVPEVETFKGKFPLTEDFINKSKRMGRK